MFPPVIFFISISFFSILRCRPVASTTMDTKRVVVVEQAAKEMPDMKDVRLRMTGLHLHASGVFSNVYKGTLVLPNGSKEIAIKKTWPESRERNFEMIFLTGVSRERHKNIVQMLFAFSNKSKDDKVCESFVFDFMPDTLASVCKRTALDMTDIKLYSWQLINGIKYLAAESIVHRDIKPINILVDHPLGHLKIGDFGSAKIVQPGATSTPYQVTRFYRPPELLLGSTVYSCTVDLWSAGCVIGEMLRGSVLFQGRDTKHQLRLIFSTFGNPSEDEMRAMKSPTRLDVDERVPGAGLAALLPECPAEAVFFLGKVLVYKPKDRLGGKEALKHPFFDSILKEGSRRSTGQPIGHIITPSDVKDAHSDDKGQTRKLSQLMTSKFDFNIGNEPKQTEKAEKVMKLNSNSDSNEDVAQLRRRPSAEKMKKPRTMSSTSAEKLPSRETVKKSSHGNGIIRKSTSRDRKPDRNI